MYSEESRSLCALSHKVSRRRTGCNLQSSRGWPRGGGHANIGIQQFLSSLSREMETSCLGLKNQGEKARRNLRKRTNAYLTMHDRMVSQLLGKSFESWKEERTPLPRNYWAYKVFPVTESGQKSESPLTRSIEPNWALNFRPQCYAVLL
jgi:hypothetical protein